MSQTVSCGRAFLLFKILACARLTFSAQIPNEVFVVCDPLSLFAFVCVSISSFVDLKTGFLMSLGQKELPQ